MTMKMSYLWAMFYPVREVECPVFLITMFHVKVQPQMLHYDEDWSVHWMPKRYLEHQVTL
jgi:hypothetical protein